MFCCAHRAMFRNHTSGRGISAHSLGLSSLGKWTCDPVFQTSIASAPTRVDRTLGAGGYRLAAKKKFLRCGHPMPLLGCRILIVEDEALIARGLSRSLESSHAVVVGWVNNVAGARSLVSEVKIDCAILDVHLRGQNIAALIPELNARHIPRVFMTAYSGSDLPKALTAWPVLEKPIYVGAVLSAVNRAIKNPAEYV